MTDLASNDFDECPLRIAIDGIELKCPVRGDHTIHKYRSRTGKRFEVQFEPLEER